MKGTSFPLHMSCLPTPYHLTREDWQPLWGRQESSYSVLTSKTSFQRGLRSSRTTWLRKLRPATFSLT